VVLELHPLHAPADDHGGRARRGARGRARGAGICRGARSVRTQQLINGAWVDAVDGGRNDVIDPATEQVVANVPFGGAADVVKAIDAADRAFAGWKARTAYDRGAILVRAAELMRQRADKLGELTTREAGKPIAEAVREWQIAGDLFEFFA